MSTSQNKNSESMEEKFLIAQYQGLKSEIMTRTGGIYQILSFTLAVFGAILAVVYHDSKNPLPLLLPAYIFISFAASVVYVTNKQIIYEIGKYTREYTEAWIERVGNTNFDGDSGRKHRWWETHVHDELHFYKGLRSLVGILIFAGTQLLALIAYVISVYSSIGDRTDYFYHRLILLILSSALFILTTVFLFNADSGSTDLGKAIKKLFRRARDEI